MHFANWVETQSRRGPIADTELLNSLSSCPGRDPGGRGPTARGGPGGWSGSRSGSGSGSWWGSGWGTRMATAAGGGPVRPRRELAGSELLRNEPCAGGPFVKTNFGFLEVFHGLNLAMNSALFHTFHFFVMHFCKCIVHKKKIKRQNESNQNLFPTGFVKSTRDLR